MLTPAMLTCGHTVQFDPPALVGSEVYCRACRTWRIVKHGHDSWTIRCSDCKYSQGYGTDESRARRCAVRHANKYGHAVDVRRAGQSVTKMDGTGTPTTDLLEWLKTNPGHQRSLRSL